MDLDDDAVDFDDFGDLSRQEHEEEDAVSLGGGSQGEEEVTESAGPAAVEKKPEQPTTAIASAASTASSDPAAEAHKIASRDTQQHAASSQSAALEGETSVQVQAGKEGAKDALSAEKVNSSSSRTKPSAARTSEARGDAARRVPQEGKQGITIRGASSSRNGTPQDPTAQEALTAPSAKKEPAQTTPDELPPDWKIKHSRSGETYYYNTVTRETTWDKPIVAAQLPSTGSAAAASSSSEKASASAQSKAKSSGGIQILGAARKTATPHNSQEPALQEQPSKKRDAADQGTLGKNESQAFRTETETNKRQRQSQAKSKSPRDVGGRDARRQDQGTRNGKPLLQNSREPAGYRADSSRQADGGRRQAQGTGTEARAQEIPGQHEANDIAADSQRSEPSRPREQKDAYAETSHSARALEKSQRAPEHNETRQWGAKTGNEALNDVRDEPRQRQKEPTSAQNLEKAWSNHRQRDRSRTEQQSRQSDRAHEDRLDDRGGADPYGRRSDNAVSRNSSRANANEFSAMAQDRWGVPERRRDYVEAPRGMPSPSAHAAGWSAEPALPSPGYGHNRSSLPPQGMPSYFARAQETYGGRARDARAARHEDYSRDREAVHSSASPYPPAPYGREHRTGKGDGSASRPDRAHAASSNVPRRRDAKRRSSNGTTAARAVATGREQELAEREAAIARRERELGMRMR